MTKNRAWVMVEPQKVVMQEFEIHEVTEDCALLKVEACGVCGTDKHMYFGQLPMATPPYPFVAGHEIIGTIVELGKKANESMAVFGGTLEEGDRVALAPGSLPCGKCWHCLHMPSRPVFCPNRSFVYGMTSLKKNPNVWGGYSEYIYLFPKSQLFKISKNMAMKRAVLIEPMATALRAVERAYSPGEPEMRRGYGVGRSTMVLGAGPIGLMVVAALRYSGAGLIIVQDLLPNRLEMAKRLGADITIDGNLPLEDRLKQVKDITDMVGPDVTIEAAGAPLAFKEAVDFVRRGGKLIEVGNFTNNGPTEIIPFFICNKDLDIHGSWGYPSVIFRDVIAMLEQMDSPVEDVVTHVLPLQEFPKGLELTGTKDVGKVALAP